MSQISVFEETHTLNLYTDLCSGRYRQSSESDINKRNEIEYPLCLIEPDCEDNSDFTDDEKKVFYQELAEWNNPLIFSSEHPILDPVSAYKRIYDRMDFCGHHVEMARYYLDKEYRETGKRLSIIKLGSIFHPSQISETHLLVRGPKGEYKKIVYSQTNNFGVCNSLRFTSISPHEVRQLPFVRTVELEEGEEEEERVVTIEELLGELI
jgi:hypothetical protein